MKIMRVTSFFYPVEGGMETHVLEETKELAKRHNVEVWTSDSTRDGRVQQKEETINNVKIKRFPTWCKLSQFTPLFPQCWIRAAREDYDIMHSNSYRQTHNLCLLIAKLRKKKTVLGVHWPEYPQEYRSTIMNRIIPLFDKTIGKIIMKTTNALIVQSNEEKEWIQKKFNIKQEKIHIIPPGINEDYLKQRNKEIFKKKYNITKPMVLYLGRLHESKGVDKIIKIADSFKDTQFVIAGAGPLLNRLKHQSKHTTNILFTGRVSEEEKLEALAGADIFIHPTNYDAFGLTLLEAHAQGTITLATHVGGIPTATNNAGLTFKDTIPDMKKQLKRLLEDKKLQQKLKKETKKHAQQHTWKKLTKQLEEVYNENVHHDTDI